VEPPLSRRPSLNPIARALTALQTEDTPEARGFLQARRAFRSEVGLPPYEYLTYLRVSRARTLLQGGGMRVADAAQAVGFCDESRLHRHFRRIVGVGPGAYARSFAGTERKPPTSPKSSRRGRRTLAA
jgi:methylphosphotriester-DNA--protein-cysteine methyltransferase